MRNDTAVCMLARDADRTESDEDLMLAWQAGDAAAFDMLYARHRAGTFRYLLRHCGNRSEAEELHQDVWFRVIASRAAYEPRARLATWLYTIARNRLVDHWRARGARRTLSLDGDTGVERPDDDPADDPALADPAPASDPLRAAVSAQQGHRIIAALGALPGAQRDAFLLHIEGGLALAEIAELTGVPAETVKSRLRYAYARLRAALGDLQ